MHYLCMYATHIPSYAHLYLLVYFTDMKITEFKKYYEAKFEVVKRILKINL